MAREQPEYWEVVAFLFASCSSSASVLPCAPAQPSFPLLCHCWLLPLGLSCLLPALSLIVNCQVSTFTPCKQSITPLQVHHIQRLQLACVQLQPIYINIHQYTSIHINTATHQHINNITTQHNTQHATRNTQHATRNTQHATRRLL